MSDQTFRVSVASTMFPAANEARIMPVGLTIAEALDRLSAPVELRTYFDISLQGDRLPPSSWCRVRPKANTLVSVGVRPGFDNDMTRTLAILASSFGGSMIGRAIGGVRGGFVGQALSWAGIWLTSTLLPPTPPDKPEPQTASGFGNTARKWGKVPRVYGRLRIFPALAAEPVLDVIGNDLYTRVLFLLGQRPLQVEMDTLKLGETTFQQFQDVQIDVHDGWYNTSTEQFTLYSRDTHMETLNRELLWAENWTAGNLTPPSVAPRVLQLVTAENTVEFTLDLTFPDGLGYQRTDSEFDGYTVDLAVRFRPQGSSGDNWVNVTPAAVASQEYLNNELHPITSTQLFAWLTQLNETLDDAITALTAIGLGERVLTEALFWFATQQFTAAEQMLTGTLDADTDLTDEQRTMVEATRTKMDDLGVLVQTATRTTEAFRDDLVNFNSLLSGALTALYVIDGILGTWEYLRRGYGPESDFSDALVNIADRPLLGRVLQLVFGKWNFRQIFGDPPEGTFRLVNADRVKGVIRKKVSVMGLPAGTYEVQVRRASEPNWDPEADNTATDYPRVIGTGPDPAYNDKYKERVELTAFISVQRGVPMTTRMHSRHAALAARIRLSNQQGTVDNLNVVVASPLPWYKPGEGWQPAALIDDQARPVHKNPAWIVCDILRGLGNKRPAGDTYIDVDRFVDWADYCFDSNLFFSGVFDQRTTVLRAIDDVCRVGKASRTMRWGKHSVVYDHVIDQAVDLLTTRTSANTHVKRSYGKIPHALRIPFVNPDKNWADDEWIVYDDTHGDPDTQKIVVVTRPAEGDRIVLPYHAESIEKVESLPSGFTHGFGGFHVEYPDDYPNTTWLVHNGGPWPDGNYRIHLAPQLSEAEIYETVDLKGLVDSHDQTSVNHTGQVYALGRYLLKAAVLRPELTMTDIDFAHLKLQRGSRVDVQSDVLLWGLGSARLMQAPTRDGSGNITALALDAAFDMEAGKAYEITLRAANDNRYSASVVTVAGRNTTVTLTAPLDDNGDLDRGDLVVWGEHQLVTTPCIVKGLELQGDDTARVTLVEHAPAVHDAPEEPIPPFDSRITIPPRVDLMRPPMPEVIGIATDESVLLRQADGSYQSRIRVGFRVPEGTTDTERAVAQAVSHVEAQFRLTFRATAGDLVVYYAPDANTAWQSGGYVTKDSGVLYLAPVQDGFRYDVRVRCITRGGVPGEWNLTESVAVVGKSSPPPDVTQARVDGDNLRWEYPVPPLDLRGFLVRQVRGVSGSWASASPAHDGVLSATSLSLAAFQGGPREFFIKAVDTSGNESVNAAVVVVDAGTVTPADETDRYEHRAHTWPGTRTNMEVDAGDLVASAGSMSGFYAGPGAPYYRGAAEDYYTTDYQECAYEFDHVVDDGALPYTIGIDIAATGDGWQLEVRKVDAPFWPADLAEPLWPLHADQPIWPDLEYHAYRGRVEAEAGTSYRFRVSALGSNTQLTITQVDIVTTPADRAAS